MRPLVGDGRTGRRNAFAPQNNIYKCLKYIRIAGWRATIPAGRTSSGSASDPDTPLVSAETLLPGNVVAEGRERPHADSRPPRRRDADPGPRTRERVRDGGRSPNQRYEQSAGRPPGERPQAVAPGNGVTVLTVQRATCATSRANSSRLGRTTRHRRRKYGRPERGAGRRRGAGVGTVVGPRSGRARAFIWAGRLPDR